MSRRLNKQIKKTRPQRHRVRRPREAFDFLVSLANKKSLPALLNLSAGMSSAAYVRGTGDEKLRALFHYQKMRVILDAVLRSTAGTKNEATIAVPDLPKLVNNAKCAVDVPDRELAEMTASSGTDLARLELLRMLARLGQLQIRPLSEDPLSTAGRAIALLVVVPELHPEKVLLRVKNAKAVLEHPPPTCWDWGPTVC